MFQVTISPEEGTIAVWNNGRGIPVEIHRDENCWVPELIFGHRECDFFILLKIWQCLSWYRFTLSTAWFKGGLRDHSCLPILHLVFRWFMRSDYTYCHVFDYLSISVFPLLLFMFMPNTVFWCWGYTPVRHGDTSECLSFQILPCCAGNENARKTAEGHTIPAARLVDVFFCSFLIRNSFRVIFPCVSADEKPMSWQGSRLCLCWPASMTTTKQWFSCVSVLTSSNYNDNEKKTTGGRNGYGAKLANIFSTEFTIETADGLRSGKKYKQTFTNNMQVCSHGCFFRVSFCLCVIQCRSFRSRWSFPQVWFFVISLLSILNSLNFLLISLLLFVRYPLWARVLVLLTSFLCACRTRAPQRSRIVTRRTTGLASLSRSSHHASKKSEHFLAHPECFPILIFTIITPCLSKAWTFPLTSWMLPDFCFECASRCFPRRIFPFRSKQSYSNSIVCKPFSIFLSSQLVIWMTFGPVLYVNSLTGVNSFPVSSCSCVWCCLLACAAWSWKVQDGRTG